MQEEKFTVVVKQWMRIHNVNITTNIMQIILETILIYFEKEAIINQLFVNIAIIGDDCSDKIGLIDNYIHDYNKQKLLNRTKKIELHKQNETEILKFNKIVKLSSRNSVNICILCLSEKQRTNLSNVCSESTKSIIFTYNLCNQQSLQSIRKWYKDCQKLNDSFISILVGTNYQIFKNKPANYRISIIEMSRKYAKKMKAILIFVSTNNKQQINIKEVFLMVLSQIYHFDSNIQSISNSKLPIIEYYDKYVSSGRKSTKLSHQKYNTVTRDVMSSTANRATQRYSGYNKYNTYGHGMHGYNKNNDSHNRTKTSIENIQNRLSIIRNNLENNKEKKENKKGNKAEQLYSKFEKQYENFMKNQNVEENKSPKPIEMYPSFLQKTTSTDNNGTEITHSLSDLLKNDALGLSTLDQEDETELEAEESKEIENLKKKKHERAMSMMPSLLSRSKTYDKHYNKYNVPNRAPFNKMSRSQTQVSQHNRAMPSMPNFLSKLQNDNQLKNIISKKFIANSNSSSNSKLNSKNNIFMTNNSNSKMGIEHVHKIDGSGSRLKNNDIKKLKNKIQNLELALSKYKNIMNENSKTVSVLKNTIQKIQNQRDEATRQIEVLNNDGNSNKEKEIEKLKNKNVELKSLADALAINLTRKQQSLEEALDAIHSLNEVKEQISLGHSQNKSGSGGSGNEHSISRSLTDADILEIDHSNVHIDDDDSDDGNGNGNSNGNVANGNHNHGNEKSFRKGIARRLRKSLTNLTSLDAKKSQ